MNFITFTCNMAEHFGLIEIKNWIDYGIWKNFCPNYSNCKHAVQKESNTESEESVVFIFLRNWTEIKIIHSVSASK